MVRMLPRPARVAIAVSAAALALGLSACAPSSPEPSPTPPSTTDAAAPIFESDEEALQAAVEAYERYVEVSSAIGADGGENPERIEEVIDEAILEDALADFEEIRTRQVRTEGASTYDSVSFVQRSESDSRATVELRLCRDVNTLRIIDANGADVTPTDRAERVPTQVIAVSSPGSPDQLVIGDLETWPGDDFC